MWRSINISDRMFVLSELELEKIYHCIRRAI